jgi:DNA polymerase-3 subunit alpha
MGFSGYFLIVWDFINYAREKGIPVGPGRGSAAGSLAAYCMRITDVDPLQYELLFERFLNPERISMPDIDIDFCIRGRGDVIDKLTKIYGKESGCQIITF